MPCADSPAEVWKLFHARPSSAPLPCVGQRLPRRWRINCSSRKLGGYVLEDLKQRILTYLVDRPRAMDTVEGIALYWVHAEVDEVRRALVDLVQTGQLMAYRQAGQVYYRALTVVPRRDREEGDS
jgi:hypothetical protein